MDPMRQSMLDTLERFKQRVPQNKSHIFESATLEDVQFSILRIQRDQERLAALMNMRRMENFLHLMDLFGKTLSHLMSGEDADKLMAFVWGPVQHLLEASCKDNHPFDNVLDAYNILGNTLPRFYENRSLFEQSPDARHYLVDVYDDIATFHWNVIGLLTGKTWGRLFKSSWRNFHYTFDHIREKLQLGKTLVETSEQERSVVGVQGANDDYGATAIDIRAFAQEVGQYRRRRITEAERHKRAEEERKEKEKKEVLDWLAPVEMTEISHRDFCAIWKQYENTGRWILKTDKVENWLYSEDTPPNQSTLWIHAKKGAGKTVLASRVVEECMAQDADTYYFYFKRDEPQQSTFLAMVRSLLHQAVRQNARFVPHCHDKMKESGFHNLNNADVAKAILNLIFETKPHTFVIVDGLDECAGPELKQAVTFLNAAVSKCDGISPGQLRVLFSSLQLSEMKKHFASASIMEIQKEDNFRDIEMFVRAEAKVIAEKHNLETSSTKDIIEATCRNAEGMFLYARLVMQDLKMQLSKKDVLRLCGEYRLPSHLETLYNNILRTLKTRLDQEGEKRWPKAVEILGWIVAAKRPLTWHEMQGILSFDPDAREVDMDMNMLRGNIDEMLGELVHVITGHGVRLAHETAKAYVTKFVVKQEVEVDLAVRCLRYLSLPCFKGNISDEQRRKFAREGYYSFQDYAVANWIRHVETIINGRNAVSVFGDPEQSPLAYKLHSALLEFISTYPEVKDRKEAAAPTTMPLQTSFPSQASSSQMTSLSQGSPSRPSSSQQTLFSQEISSSQQRQSQLESPEDQCRTFQQYSFHDSLLTVWQHIRDHQSSKFDTRNSNSLKGLQKALDESRKVLESLDVNSSAVNNDKVEDYYGDKPFKCSRLLCEFFYIGFRTEKDREHHGNRHERPFACPIDGCTQGPFGFASNKDKDRHVRMYHPELADKPPAFVQLTRRPAAELPRFPCTVPGCGKTFTRNINLRGHIRSHFGERPYACSMCGKSFTRINDCRRHEKIHQRDTLRRA